MDVNSYSELPPFTKIPTLIGWDFFARNASVGAVSRLGLLSTPLPKSPFRARIPPFFSLCSLLPS